MKEVNEKPLTNSSAKHSRLDDEINNSRPYRNHKNMGNNNNGAFRSSVSNIPVLRKSRDLSRDNASDRSSFDSGSIISGETIKLSTPRRQNNSMGRSSSPENASRVRTNPKMTPSPQIMQSNHTRNASAYSISTMPGSYDSRISREGLSRKPTMTSLISKPSAALSATSDPAINEHALEKPKLNDEIERMFIRLMEKRDFRSLPQQAKLEMKNYSFDKKWMLIYQDALAEQKRHERVVRNKEENATPEFYTKLLLSKTISGDQLKNLWVSLRTEPIDWVRSFIYDCQGDAILSAYLIKIRDAINDQELIYIDNEIFDKEFNTLKALKCMMNQKLGAERVRTDVNLYVNAVSGSLLSPRILTRRIAGESLTFIIAYYSHKSEGGHFIQERYKKILQALDTIPSRPYFEFSSSLNSSSKTKLVRRRPDPSSYKRFELWLKFVSKTIDGKGKYIHSLVGASEELKYAHSGGGSTNLENHLLEYCLGTMLLINTIVEYGMDVKLRIHLRAQFSAAGLDQLLSKFQEFSYENLNQQCLKYLELARADENELKTKENILSVVDFKEPVSLIDAIWNTIKDTEASGYFLSAMQHLYLNHSEKKDDTAELYKSLRLLDDLIQNISMAQNSDNESTIGVAINNLMSGLKTDEMYKKAIDEVKYYKKIAEEASADTDEMSRQLSIGTDGVIASLTNELKEQEAVSLRTRKMNAHLVQELDSLKKKHIAEKQEQELEMRELLVTLNRGSNQKTPNSSTFSTIRDNATSENGHSHLVRQLENQINRRKREYTLDNKKYGALLEPSSRLRALRDQMGNIEIMARELEMTDFETYDPSSVEPLKKVEETSKDSNNENDETNIETNVEPLGPSRPCREDDLEKLDNLRKKLASLQFESNGIMKFNTSSMFNKQKMLALDRLKDLQNEFQNYNIDFNLSEDSESFNFEDHVDPSIKAKIEEEYRQVIKLKQEVEKKFAELSNSNNVSDGKQSSTGKPIESEHGQIKTDNGDTARSLEEESGNEVEKDVSANRTTATDKNRMHSPDASAQLNETKEIAAPEKKSDTGSPPPPPPPLPSMLNKDLQSPENKTPDNGEKLAPPPPPPLPSILSHAEDPKDSKDTSAAVPPPPPPPPFPMPRNISNTQRWDHSFTLKTPLDHVVRPKKKLKQLHWEKFDNTCDLFWQNSLSDTIAEDLQAKGIFDEIEVIFAAKEIKKLATKKREDVDKISFLPRDLAQQFGINLHLFNNLSEEKLISKVLNCDDDIIHNQAVLEFFGKDDVVEVTNYLARNFEPYCTDFKQEEVTRPEKDPNELQRADRIYLELVYNLQHYWKSRIRALSVLANHQKEYNELMHKLRNIDEAIDGLRNSENLKRVFEIILAVGNYMNDANKQALGFKLGSLQRLSFLKDDKNSMTLLHYVEKIIRIQYPQVMKFLDEIGKCREIFKYSIESIANDCKDYSRNIANVQSSVDIGNLSDVSKFHPDDKIIKVITPVLPKAQRKSQLLADQSSCTFKEFDAVMRYFGEDPSDPFIRNSFLSKFSDFITDFKKVQKENISRENEMRMYESRRKLLDVNKSKQENESADENDNHVMDTLLDRLKQAGPAKGEYNSARKKAMLRKNLLSNQKASSQPLSFPLSPESHSETTYHSVSSEKLHGDAFISELESAESNEDDVGSRARNLLKELRNGSEDNSDSNISNAKQQFLQRKVNSSERVNENDRAS